MRIRYLISLLLLAAIAALPAAAQSGWNLTFSDEFNGSSLNTSAWQTQYNFGCTNNDELEGYEPSAVTESGGRLTLTASHTSNSCSGGKSYTSGMILSKSAFTYGYYEARIQVPAYQGFWPAFWLLPPSAWPPEIDAIELGQGGDFSTIRMTNHYGTQGSGSYDSQTYNPGSAIFGMALHTIAVDWEPGSEKFYVDGTLRATITAPSCPGGSQPGGTGAECISSTPMNVIANLAVGGSYTGGVGGSTPFPSQMLIDYVRVYQHPASGAGCYSSIPSPTTIPSTSCTPPPAIFFSDVTSGPNTGGDTQSGFAGEYVTLYGNYFGTTQGTSTVTLNGASCLRVVSWGGTWMWYQKIVVQLGSSCSTGAFAVTVGGQTTTGPSFTVRAGNIYCISTTGNDSSAGTFPSSCWATAAHAESVMVAGDTTYVQNGVLNTTVSAFQAVVNITGNPGGTSSAPIFLIAYPGATATIGDYNSSPWAIRVPQIGDSPAYYGVAGLTIRGQAGFDGFQMDHLYLIGNDISCSGGNGYGCTHYDTSTNQFVYGNNVHNIGGNGKLYHGMYFTTNTNHVWVGWNTVDPDPAHTGTAGCRGIQFYSTGGADQFDIHVHDNIIRDTICDGLNMNTVNPALGTVEAYNNVIYHAGTGPDPSGQGAGYMCILVSTMNGATAPARIYNNSMYDCGSRGIDQWGALGLDIGTTVTNNSVYMLTNEPYLASGTIACGSLSGQSNDWFGNGTPPCPANFTSSGNFNPQYTSTTLGATNLTPLSTSGLFGAGSSSLVPTYDITGVVRPAPPSMGAYEPASSGGIAPPPPVAPPSITVIQLN